MRTLWRIGFTLLLLTVVLGLILGWIMLAVLGPIYDTISKIRA